MSHGHKVVKHLEPQGFERVTFFVTRRSLNDLNTNQSEKQTKQNGVDSTDPLTMV